LQLKILPRLQSLGIIGVLPAFAGFVPDAMTYAYPNASIAASPLWLHPAEYSAVRVLSATDPMFAQISQAFLSHYATAYAEVNYTLQGYYSADTFNELTPSSSDPQFLKRYAAATWGGMAAHDPGAVWVLQAWAFGAGYWTNQNLEAYLSGVDNAHMLLLDLVSDQMPLWNGQWAQLHSKFILQLKLYNHVRVGPACVSTHPVADQWFLQLCARQISCHTSAVSRICLFHARTVRMSAATQQKLATGKGLPARTTTRTISAKTGSTVRSIVRAPWQASHPAPTCTRGDNYCSDQAVTLGNPPSSSDTLCE
jgi:hypothetical protein